MDKINLVIVEDEFVIAEDLRDQLVTQGYEVLSVLDTAEAALPYIIQHKPDIILVDIRLHGPMDGIDLVNQVQPVIQLPVIFITANSESSVYERAIKSNPNAFLVKPFTSANLLAAIDLALYNFASGIIPENIDRQKKLSPDDSHLLMNQSLFIRSNGKHIKILPKNILFVEAARSYVHLQTTKGRHLLSYNLAHFIRKTPLPSLLRIHRSYIINVNLVDSFDDSFVYIKNHKLPLGENYRAEFLSRVHFL